MPTQINSLNDDQGLSPPSQSSSSSAANSRARRQMGVSTAIGIALIAIALLWTFTTRTSSPQKGFFSERASMFAKRWESTRRLLNETAASSSERLSKGGSQVNSDTVSPQSSSSSSSDLFSNSDVSLLGERGRSKVGGAGKKVKRWYRSDEVVNSLIVPQIDAMVAASKQLADYVLGTLLTRARNEASSSSQKNSTQNNTTSSSSSSSSTPCSYHLSPAASKDDPVLGLMQSLLISISNTTDDHQFHGDGAVAVGNEYDDAGFGNNKTAMQRGPGGEVAWRLSPPLPAIVGLKFSYASFKPTNMTLTKHEEGDAPSIAAKNLILSERNDEKQHLSRYSQFLPPPQNDPVLSILPPRPPMYVLVLRNALMRSGHVVSCGGVPLKRGGCERPEPAFQNFGGDTPTRLPAANVQRVEIGIAIDTKRRWNYYHLTHEIMTRVALVHPVLTAPNSSAFLVVRPYSSFIQALLCDVLGIPPRRILQTGFVSANIALYPAPHRCGAIFTHSLYLLRSIVFQRLGIAPDRAIDSEGGEQRQDLSLPFSSCSSSPSTPRRYHILFSQRLRGSRMPAKFEQVKAAIKNRFKNNKAVTFETLQGSESVERQIRSFHSADIVIGPHGANLANIMWMRRGAHVIEFLPTQYANTRFFSTSRSVGLTHDYISYSGSKTTSGYYVDAELLIACIQRALPKL